MYLSIIIPTKNERDNIQPLVREIASAMQSLNKEYEIIFIDDGSKDGSLDEMIKMKKEFPQIRILKFDKNYGQTSALDAGIRNAKGEIISMLDGDMQSDANDILKLLDELKDFDMVVGIRQKRQDNFIKKISSKIANSVRNKFTNDDIIDTGCPLKVFKKECFNKVKLFTGLHRFLPTLVKLEGYKVKQIPVRHLPRLRGKTKYNIRNRLFKSLRDLFAVRWMQRRYLHYKIEKEL